MADITEEVLRKKIAKILDNAKLNETSTKKVIQKLEENLGVDLKDRKKLVDQLVMEYVNNLESEEEEEEEASSVEEKASTEEEKEQDDSNDSDWGKNSKRRKVEEKKKKSPPKPAAKPKKAGGGGRKGSGYTRAYKLSPALAQLMGAEEMPRHEVVKRVWAIIKEKQLYDPSNKQFAICDKPLYKVIGTQRFRIFGMMKYLKTHFLDD